MKGKKQTNDKEIMNLYKSQGYEVLRAGWPDFVAIRENEIQFVEVKSFYQPLSFKQRLMHEFFKTKLGHEIKVITMPKPKTDVTTTN